jgi:hypothetical protein
MHSRTVSHRVSCRGDASRTGQWIGLSSEQAAAEIKILESAFDMLPDAGDIYPQWRDLVETAKSLGKTNHDARLCAFAVVHGCLGLLTYNVDDFICYTRLIPSVAVVSPIEV